MAETLILDPNEVATGRVSFDITSYVGAAGPDWGDAAIEQYLADVQLGQLPVDYRLPSRTITIPLLLRTDPLVSFETLRKRVQQKTGLFQREGGWVKRQTALGPLFAEVTGAQLKLGGSTAQALWGIDADAVLTLTTLPDWYGNEVVGDAANCTVRDGGACLSRCSAGSRRCSTRRSSASTGLRSTGAWARTALSIRVAMPGMARRLVAWLSAV
jgi:hypothetical protein